MRPSFRHPIMLVAGSFLVGWCTPSAPAQSTSQGSTANSSKPASTTETSTPEHDLLDAMKKGLVAVRAEGTGDGRITISVTNRTNRPLRVVLPPGIVAQGATGQMGGMGGGGMGGGM